MHANTVGAVYRNLERSGWLEFRKGSGVIVPTRQRAGSGEEFALDRLVAWLFKEARSGVFGMPEVRKKLRAWIEMQPPDQLLPIEPDEELRRILEAEIRQTVDEQVISAGTSQPARLAAENRGRRIAGVPVQQGGADLCAAPCRLRLPDDALIVVVSRWPDFCPVDGDISLMRKNTRKVARNLRQEQARVAVERTSPAKGPGRPPVADPRPAQWSWMMISPDT